MPNLTLDDGDQLAFSTVGSGEPLLLVLGTSLSVGHWPPGVIEALSTDHRVITYDHRGMGSSSPSERAVDMSLLASDAASLLDHLGARRAHVLGWSLGSAVAQELALARPDLVSSLLLYATWARSDGFQRAVMTALRTPWVYADMTNGIAALALSSSPEAVNTAEYAAAVEAWLPYYPQTEEQIAMTLRQWDANVAHDTFDRLPGIAAPTTVLVGEQDLLTPPRLASVVADQIPGAQLELMTGPGSSHAMIYEREHDWLAAVRKHLLRCL